MKAGFLFALMTVPGYSICLLRLDQKQSSLGRAALCLPPMDLDKDGWY